MTRENAANRRSFGNWMCIVLLASIVSSCKVDERPPLLALGKTYEECQALYGPGELLKYDAPNKRMVRYSGFSAGKVRVVFLHDVAAYILYEFTFDSLDDKNLNYCLQMNAQSHKWALVHVSTDHGFQAKWNRDDGANASCDKGGLLKFEPNAPQ